MKLAAFLRELGQPVAYYPKLAKITGGILANLFLCQMYYWQGKQDDPDGWIYKTQAEIEAETGLSRSEQETARRLLRQRGLLKERYKGLPRRLEFWLDEQELENRWAFFLQDKTEKPLLKDSKTTPKRISSFPAKAPQVQTESSQAQPLETLPERDSSIMRSSCIIACRNSADNSAATLQASLLEKSKQVCCNPADNSAATLQASLLEKSKQVCGNPAGNIYTENTTEITTENTNRDYNTHPPNPPSHEQPCEGDDLPAEKIGGSPADLPADRIDQLELLEKKNCHDSHFSTAKEKIAGSQPDFSASLLEQSELTEKPKNSGEDFNSAAAAPSIEIDVPAIQPHTPLFKQPVVVDLGQPSLGEARELLELRKLREKELIRTRSFDHKPLDSSMGVAPGADSAPSAPKAPPTPPALFSQEHSASTRNQNESRASLRQPHLPKNLDGSDRLPWDTDKRGMFDPKFENWMARSLMQYPAYRDLMAGELMTKVRKHISAGRYDLKRRDELLIEWSAMLDHQNADEFATHKSTLTAKGAARRAEIARALSMEVS